MSIAVAIDSWTISRLLTYGELPRSWPSAFAEDIGDIGCRRIEIADVIYFLRAGLRSLPQLLVVDTRPSSGLFGAFGEGNRREAFLRLCRAAQVAFSQGRESVPAKWGPYNVDSRMSFYAQHVIHKRPFRIELDIGPRNTPHVYAYCLGNQPRELKNVRIDYGAFDAALHGLDDAALAAMETEDETAGTGVHHTLVGIDREDRLGLGLNTQQWLERLTAEQRAFVTCPLDRSVRLIGSAGTGKTLSLIVKCLIEFERRGDSPDGYRSLFLTFSQTNVDHVTAAIASMDHSNVLQRWPNSCLKICTVQSLAYEGMKLETYGLAPISLDGVEGRTWQRWILDEVIAAYRSGDWITRRSRCSNWVREGVEAIPGSAPAIDFTSALMHEFACVIEPQGVRKGAEEREAYIKARRRPWMIVLESRDDRLCILDIYDRYRRKLREDACIGADQLTADFLVELGTNRWDQIRYRSGFDSVFVDELHLFNRQERMIPHLLMRDPGKAPIVVMAYDFKQSTRVTYGTAWNQVGPVHLSREMGLGETERFELNQAFRYTPEIAAMLEWIDQAIPAAGIAEELGNEWRNVTTNSRLPPGRKPTLTVLDNTLATYRHVFPRARRKARLLGKGGAVAVLCLSEQLFESYLQAGEHKDAFVAITDREEFTPASKSRNKFVLSMPEFVAGMQFDTVYLIEVNDGEVREGPDVQGRRLQFVTQVYLGASRAESVLEMYASSERGGAARCLVHAIEQSTVRILSVDELEDPP